MKTTIALLTGLVLGVAIDGETRRTDVGQGQLHLLPGFEKTRTDTKDSFMGQISSKDSVFVINYDIGKMAGLRMHPEKKGCKWFKEQVIGDQRYYVGLHESGGGKKLTVSIMPSDKKPSQPWRYPANFWSEVKSDEQVVEFLLTAFSYTPKAGKE